MLETINVFMNSTIFGMPPLCWALALFAACVLGSVYVFGCFYAQSN